MGDWETLFVITAFGTIVLIPFVYNDIAYMFSYGDVTLFLLLGVSTVLLIAALLDFESLKKGKIAVVEPVLALEVPVTVILAFAVINESLQLLDIFLITTLILGLILVSLKTRRLTKKAWLERGVVLAAIGAFFMGTSNFLVGFASRVTNPLFANWFINIFLAVVSLFYIMSHKRTGVLFQDFKGNSRLIIGVSIFDNLAWIAFAFAATLIPIAIAVAISESYIALAALLGLVVSKEKLMKHQHAGLAIALTSAVALAAIYA